MSAPPARFHDARLYSFYFDGHFYTKSFRHHAGMSPADNTDALNREFHEWLELQAPGAYAAGRVHGITFSDFMETDEW